jgi:hypothetical protein
VPVARTHSIALVGVEGHAVEIESDIENGLPGCCWSACPTPRCARAAQPLPPPQPRAIESGAQLHLHFHGVKAEDVAAIIQRSHHGQP